VVYLLVCWDRKTPRRTAKRIIAITTAAMIIPTIIFFFRVHLQWNENERKKQSKTKGIIYFVLFDAVFKFDLLFCFGDVNFCSIRDGGGDVGIMGDILTMNTKRKYS
jgi:hypothetical protein